MTNRRNCAIRLLTCVLIGTTGLWRIAHVGATQSSESTPGNHAEDLTSSCSHSPATDSSKTDTHGHGDPTGDSDHCVVCHLLAIGSSGVTTDVPSRIVIAPPVDRRVPPTLVTPHSADIDLPLSARAPPLA